MRRTLIRARRCFVTALILAISLSAYGCSDSVSVSDDVQVPLASLTVTPGTLQPGFFANTTNYGVNAPTSATSVTVTATPKDSTVIMTINGTLTAAGQGRSITLGAPGSTTTITILLEAQNGTETTYTVNVTRLLSSDNNLTDLGVTPGNLVPPFDLDIKDYTVNVGVLVERVDVSATKSDPNAVMVISWATGSVTIGAGDNRPGQADNIPLDGPGLATPVSIEVTAPNGSKKIYRITINRLSGDNNLSNLTVAPGTMSPPVFDANHLGYTVDVATDVEQVTVTATKSDPNAAMSGSVNAGSGIQPDTAPIALGGPGSETRLSIIVAATDPNVVPKTYNIIVKRAAPSSDNNLSALTVTPGTWAPNNPFNPNTTSYTVDVATDVTQVTISATKSDLEAVIAMGSVTVPPGTLSGQETFPLTGPGTDTPILIMVTAPNGIPKDPPYTITVKRAAPAAPAAPSSAPDMTPESDSGVDNTDNITNINTPSFTVAQQGPGETPNLYVDGSIAKQGFDLGANTLTPTVPLTDGIHTVTSTVTNAAGLESTQSPSLIVTIDTVAP